MICILALIVFGILGIFSVKYRIIAKEAFDCVFRRITFRKCTSGLDIRLKAQITGNLMKKAPNIATKVYKNFEIISWFFTIILIVSLIWSGIGLYNFVLYGNCNGEDSTEFCIFNGLEGRKEIIEQTKSCGCINTDECILTGFCKDKKFCECKEGICVSK
ncbi:MAG TPA: hypothetical protein VJB89_01825 [Candidatus Nanoarchaeia archaeon]|nr:hypothetical protein [Candidatus Nanoarchaeia archaeon]